MSYISVEVDVDVDDVLDELDDDDLVEELEERAKKANITTYDFITHKHQNENIGVLSGRRLRPRLAVILGLNKFASKEDIINLLNEKL